MELRARAFFVEYGTKGNGVRARAFFVEYSTEGKSVLCGVWN